MLPEHAQAVRDWLDEDGQMERPILDDWELESIQMEIESAYKRQCEASVTTWRNGKEFTYIGKIFELDHRLNGISMDGPFGEDRLSVVDIIRVRCMY